MMGGGAVQYVGGGFSLVAFIVSAIFYAYRERLHTKAAGIKSAPTHDQLEAIATEAEFFRVNVSNLSTEQQSNIFVEELPIAHPMDPPRQTNWTHPTPDRWIESSLGVQNVFSTTRRIHNGFGDGTVVAAVDRANVQLLISDSNCLSKGLYVRILPACAWNGMPQLEDVR